MKFSWNRRSVIVFLIIIQYLTYSSADSFSTLLPKSKATSRRQNRNSGKTPPDSQIPLTEMAVAQPLRGGEAAPAVSDSAGNTVSPLTKVRQAVFPIYGKEVRKFLLIGSIKFFIILALTLTRDTKDTLVVTQCGAEAIAFLKVRCLDMSVGLPFISRYLIESSPSVRIGVFKIDLRGIASCHRFHCSIFKAIECVGKENPFLHDLHSLFYILWFV